MLNHVKAGFGDEGGADFGFNEGAGNDIECFIAAVGEHDTFGRHA